MGWKNFSKKKLGWQCEKVVSIKKDGIKEQKFKKVNKWWQKNRHVQITKIVVKNIPGNHRKLLMTTDEAEEGRFQMI